MKLLKKLLLVMMMFAASITTTMTWAAHEDTLLVLDMRNLPELPKHFRTAKDKVDSHINTKGLTDLPLAGSAQFSKLALDKILERLQTKHLTIIDLRQESHGFLNGNAISWYAPDDAANAGLTPQQVEKRQASLLRGLSRQKTAKIYVILSKTPNERIDETRKLEFSMRSVSSEAELTDRPNLNYRHLYVQDHHVPSPKQVDRFIAIVKSLPQDEWVYFHCRAGMGRTTTFMAMYDMMRNAKKVSYEDIIARQAALGGKDLAHLPAPGVYQYQAAVDRLDFLKQFYQYAHDNEDDFQTTWSRWMKTHGGE
jgi:protein-tyrosine phosphatase